MVACSRMRIITAKKVSRIKEGIMTKITN